MLLTRFNVRENFSEADNQEQIASIADTVSALNAQEITSESQRLEMINKLAMASEYRRICGYFSNNFAMFPTQVYRQTLIFGAEHLAPELDAMLKEHPRSNFIAVVWDNETQLLFKKLFDKYKNLSVTTKIPSRIPQRGYNYILGLAKTEQLEEIYSIAKQQCNKTNECRIDMIFEHSFVMDAENRPFVDMLSSSYKVGEISYVKDSSGDSAILYNGLTMHNNYPRSNIYIDAELNEGSIPVSRIMLDGYGEEGHFTKSTKFEKPSNLLIYGWPQEYDSSADIAAPKYTKSLNSISYIHRGLPAEQFKSPGNVKVIKIGDLDDPYVCFDNLESVDLDLRKYASHILRRGDLLISARGTLKCSVYLPDYGEYPPCVASSNIYVVSSDPHVLNSGYLKYLIESDYGKKILGITQLKQLRLKELKELQIPIIPLTDQGLVYAPYFYTTQKYKEAIKQAKEDYEDDLEHIKKTADDISSYIANFGPNAVNFDYDPDEDDPESKSYGKIAKRDTMYLYENF